MVWGLVMGGCGELWGVWRSYGVCGVMGCVELWGGVIILLESLLMPLKCTSDHP